MAFIWSDRLLLQQSLQGFLGLLLALITGYHSKRVWIYMTLSSVAFWPISLLLQVVLFMNPPNQHLQHGGISEFSGTYPTINIAENGGTALPSIMERVRLLSTPATSAPFDDKWFWVMVTASSFLGISWIVLGIIGIWQKKGDPIARHLLLWSVLAMLFSFGDQCNSNFQFNNIPFLGFGNWSICYLAYQT